MSGLPAGTYEIAVPPLGWKTLRFVQSGVVVAADESVHLDIQLELGNEGVIGEELTVEGTLARVKPSLANARSAVLAGTGERLGASSSETRE